MKIVTAAKVFHGGIAMRYGKIADHESAQTITGVPEEGAKPVGPSGFLSAEDTIFQVVPVGLEPDNKAELNKAIDEFIAALEFTSPQNGRVLINDVITLAQRHTSYLNDRFKELLHANLSAALNQQEGLDE